ncbi:MAG TPA: Stk1 family PASTA domain-containing Ser/Thr kinase [Actinomycetota bacterium]
MAEHRREATISNGTIPERPGGSLVDFALRTLDGRYHVLDRIAAGGMGEVFRAHDAVLDREVAIKVLHRQLAGDRGFVERFRREARSAAHLAHPNIVAVHDWGAVDGIYYMVMEYVRGQSAREILNAEGPLAPAQAAEILLPVLSALDHAHRQGIVHRDVKPENVMVTRDGTVKVADFGLARAYADAQITEAGTVTGTVQYLAPEQLRGEPADPRTDLYSLGVVAYELLTARLPFTGETPMAIAYKHLHDAVPAPSFRNPAVPRGLDGWVASMTEKDRELRPESAAEARRDLEAERAAVPGAPGVGTLVPEITVHPSPVDLGRATTVTIPRPGGRSQKRGKRRRLRWVSGVLLAFAAIGAAAWGGWTYLVPREVEVPSLLGLAVDRAQAQLEELDLLPRITDGEYSSRVEEGLVLRVEPADGTVLEQGDRVTIVPSLGHAPVPVPDLGGRTLQRARTLLREGDLRLGEISRAYDDAVPEGRVVSQSVEPGLDAPFESRIDLVLSRGPFPVPVPKVIRMAEGEARAELTAAGFVVTSTEEFSDRVPAGEVISQDPAKGTELQPGNTVTIVVSLGPPAFAMPDVREMSREEAVARLTELGADVDVVVILPPGATVIYQEPPPGTTVRVGDTVTIAVR